MNGFVGDLIQYHFLFLAFLASLFVGVLSGLLSPIIISRKIDYISDGVAHATFAGVAFAFLIGVSTLPIAVIAAILFAFVVSFFSRKQKASENNMIGIFLPLFMALGILFISLTKGYVPDMMGFLFGNILLISETDLWFLSAVLVVVTVFVLLFFREIQFYAFDEGMAKHYGVPVTFIHYFTLLCLSLSVVASVKIAGVILVNAFLITPGVTARLVAKSFRQMILYAVLLSLFACYFGLYIGYRLNMPPGTTMVFTLFAEFLVFYISKPRKKAENPVSKNTKTPAV
jgi:zinc transport system permease protein